MFETMTATAAAASKIQQLGSQCCRQQGERERDGKKCSIKVSMDGFEKIERQEWLNYLFERKKR